MIISTPQLLLVAWQPGQRPLSKATNNTFLHDCNHFLHMQMNLLATLPLAKTYPNKGVQAWLHQTPWLWLAHDPIVEINIHVYHG